GLAFATAAAAAPTGAGADTRFAFDRSGFDRSRFDRGAGAFDPTQFNPGMFDPRMMRGAAAAAQPTSSRSLPIHVSCDERTNTVFIIAPADKVALGKSTLEKIDVQTDPNAK